jgi:hypothetical protein
MISMDKIWFYELRERPFYYKRGGRQWECSNYSKLSICPHLIFSLLIIILYDVMYVLIMFIVCIPCTRVYVPWEHSFCSFSFPPYLNVKKYTCQPVRYSANIYWIHEWFSNNFIIFFFLPKRKSWGVYLWIAYHMVTAGASPRNGELVNDISALCWEVIILMLGLLNKGSLRCIYFSNVSLEKNILILTLHTLDFMFKFY